MTSPIPSSLSSEQLQQFIAYFSAPLQDQSLTSTSNGLLPSPSAVPEACKATGTFLPYTFSLIGMPSALSSGNALVSSDSWVIDSGATHHVCHNRSLFTTIKPLLNTFVTLPTGNLVSIIGLGPITLSDNITLQNVLFIPQFRFNLLSVSSFTKEIESMVGFTSHHCFIQDLTRALMIGKGTQIYNLYVLDSGSLIPVPLQNNSNNVVCASVIDNHTWHSLLGHPAMDKIDSLSRLLSLNKNKKTEPFIVQFVIMLNKSVFLSLLIIILVMIVLI